MRYLQYSSQLITPKTEKKTKNTDSDDSYVDEDASDSYVDGSDDDAPISSRTRSQTMKKTYHTRSKNEQVPIVLSKKYKGIKKQRKTRRERRIYLESDEDSDDIDYELRKREELLDMREEMLRLREENVILKEQLLILKQKNQQLRHSL